MKPPPSISDWPRRALGVAAALAALLGSREALAQSAITRFSLRGEFGAGLMTPTVQRETLGYDSAHLQVTGRIGFDVIDWLSLQLSVNNGFFFTSGEGDTGRTLALQVGLRLQPKVGTLGRVWGDVNPGYYSSGTDRRIGLDAGLGFEFNLGRAIALGPFGRMHWIPADAEIHQASDAFYLSFGVSFTLRVPPSRADAALDRDDDGVPDADDRCPSDPQGDRPDPSRPGCPTPDAVADADADGVHDREDACVNVPAGAHPDPTRRGCPLTDQDRDGVADADDPCPTLPAGEHPDPARRGCPVADQDRDAISDPDDQCPSQPQGPRPDPARRGCPIGDRDHDGITDDVDRCPDRAETFNGRNDTDGCPDGAALGMLVGGRIRITEQIRFRTSSAEIQGRRSFAIIDAVAAITRATPDILTVDVEGHTDDQGEAASNRELSNQRAAAVVRELSTRGIESSRLTTHGYGSERPLVPGTSRRARTANRRIEFRVVLGDPGAAPPAGAAAPAGVVPTTAPSPPPPPSPDARHGRRRHRRH